MFRFKRNETGATTVEFMIAMPLVLFWFAGSFTFFDAYSESTRAVKATYTVADILSRQSEVDDEYIDGMNMLFSSFMGESTNDTWIRVSSIRKSSDELLVEWSTATGIHESLVLPEDIPEHLIPDIINEETLILVESYTPFVPFLDYIGIESRTYSNIVVVSPRFTPALTNNDA